MGMNPSTYKQVVDNMEKITQLIEELRTLTGKVETDEESINTLSAKIEAMSRELGDLTDLPMTVKEMYEVIKEVEDKILNPDPTTNTGDIVNTEDGVKVVGIHTNTTNKDTDSAPSSYEQGLTLELKKTDAIKLKGQEGITKDYVFVITLNQDSAIAGESAVASGKYSIQQIAYGDTAGIEYSRVSTSDTKWGDWSKMSGEGGSKQIVQSDTQPTDQKAGDYWCEPIK